MQHQSPWCRRAFSVSRHVARPSPPADVRTRVCASGVVLVVSVNEGRPELNGVKPVKRKPASLLLAASAAWVLGAHVSAHAQVSLPAAAIEGGRLWFVELAGAPSIEGRAAATVRGDQTAFRAAAAAAGLKYTERRSFNSLFNGLAIAIDPKDRTKFSRLNGVKAMYPIHTVQAPSPEQAAGAAMDLAFALSLTGANVAQDTLGLTGRNIKVGIIDTGIDIDHPAFGGSGVPGTTAFPSARVVAGYDFVGDAYDAAGSGAQLVPVPDANPDDCNGHGTHVAGIVGGNGGGIKGVAPGVKFGAYRVFGCDGSTSDDVILAALERAYADGMRVINQSLGSGREWPQAPTAQASSRLVRKGVVMVASIGNNGPGGTSPDALFAAGAPGVGKDVIGVASFDNAQRAFVVNGTPYGFTPASGAPLPPQTGSMPMAKTGTPATANDACTALPAGSLTGKAVLVRRGSCAFYLKAFNAQNAGAAAVVLYNNTAGALGATVAGAPPIVIPVVAITAAQGATLDSAIAAGPTTLNWSADVVAYPFGTGGLISSFSSYGLAADLSFKPDIGAPGGGIFSAFPLEQGGSATLSGTSMASPHVAGAAALILEALPRTPADQMDALMQNHAVPKPWSGSPGLGLLDFTFRQGAGMLNIPAVVKSEAVARISDLAIGESEAWRLPRLVTLENKSRSWKHWTITHESALASGPNSMCSATACPSVYSPTGFFDGPATLTFSRTEVVTPPRGATAFLVTVAANSGLPDRSLYGGYIKMESSDGEVLRVPYAGFKGNYQSTQVLTPTPAGFPWLAKFDGADFLNQPSGASYTMTGDDIPFFIMHLDHLSRRILLEVRDAMTGRLVGKVSDDEYVTRNSTPGGAFLWAWDGITFLGDPDRPKRLQEAPNGQYTVTVRVQKALGLPFVPEHWETWTSPVITIARP